MTSRRSGPAPVRAFLRSAAFATLAGLATLAGAGRGARAEIPVFDSAAYAQMLQQVAQGLRQIQTLELQLAAQSRMLAQLPTDISAPLATLSSQQSAILRSAEGLGYDAGQVTARFQSMFPATMNLPSGPDLAARLATWREGTRAALSDALAAQAAAAGGQAAGSDLVRSGVAASQGAAGQTAAVQATNQLLAALSQQLVGLQTVLITSARASQLRGAEQDATVLAAPGESVRALAFTLPPSRLTASPSL